MGKILHKSDIEGMGRNEGMGKNEVVLWSEPHDNDTMFALQINKDIVAFVKVALDGNITVTPVAKKKVKLK